MPATTPLHPGCPVPLMSTISGEPTGESPVTGTVDALVEDPANGVSKTGIPQMRTGTEVVVPVP